MEGDELDDIRVAVVGVGNCCSGLVQGVTYYRERRESIGLIHEKVGNFKVSDVKFVVAIDIDRRKVGKDLSEAIFMEPNNAPRMIEVPETGVKVQMGAVLDDVEEGENGFIHVAGLETLDVVELLRNRKVDVLVNMVSGSALNASIFYAEAAIKAGCAFLNATPSPIVSDEIWSNRFKDAGLPAVGDDLLDQIGATVVHIGILEFLNKRGVHIDESFQLDVGGGSESMDTLLRTRDTKRNIKTSAVASSIPYKFSLVSGSTDHVDFLENCRDSFFWFKGRFFGGAPFTMDVKLNTLDSHNAGAILLDIIRGLKSASKRGVGGAIIPLCAYGFKKPPKKKSLDEGYMLFKSFIEG